MYHPDTAVAGVSTGIRGIGARATVACAGAAVRGTALVGWKRPRTGDSRVSAQKSSLGSEDLLGTDLEPEARAFAVWCP